MRNLEDNRGGEEIQGHAGNLHHVLVTWTINLYSQAKTVLGDILPMLCGIPDTTMNSSDIVRTLYTWNLVSVRSRLA